MADAPGWSYPLGPTTRWLLAHGLPTTLAPPAGLLDHVGYRSLAGEAARHRIDGLLRTAVTDGSLQVDAISRAEAGRAEIDAVRDRMAYEDRVGRVLALLDTAGVDVRVLKGLAVARLDYDDELHRRTGDLDLAVRPDQLHAAVDTLVAHGGHWEDPEPIPGWLRHVGKGATVVLADPPVEVDLHRILVWGPLGIRLDPTELWRRARTVDIAGVPRSTLGREETLLHLCAHLLVSGVTRVTEVRDVAQVLCNPDLDVDRLLRVARRWGVESLLAVAVRHAERELALVAGAHPLEGWAAAHRVSIRERSWLRTGARSDRARGLTQLGVWVELGYGRRPGRWRARRLLVRANLWPAPGTYPPPVARLRALVGSRRRD